MCCTERYFCPSSTDFSVALSGIPGISPVLLAMWNRLHCVDLMVDRHFPYFFLFTTPGQEGRIVLNSTLIERDHF